MVVDTSILIDHIRIKDKSRTVLYRLNDEEIFISTVSLYELHLGATDIVKKRIVLDITEGLKILEFTEEAAYKAAQIYHFLKQQNKLIEFRDIFIAATCIVNNQPLATLNNKHFERIEELVLVDL